MSLALAARPSKCYRNMFNASILLQRSSIYSNVVVPAPRHYDDDEGARWVLNDKRKRSNNESRSPDESTIRWRKKE